MLYAMPFVAAAAFDNVAPADGANELGQAFLAQTHSHTTRLNHVYLALLPFTLCAAAAAFENVAPAHAAKELGQALPSAVKPVVDTVSTAAAGLPKLVGEKDPQKLKLLQDVSRFTCVGGVQYNVYCTVGGLYCSAVLPSRAALVLQKYTTVGRWRCSEVTMLLYYKYANWSAGAVCVCKQHMPHSYDLLPLHNIVLGVAVFVCRVLARTLKPSQATC